MSVLLLRLAGPMQAWGTQSRFSVRDTGLEPSKSGVIGLLCAALGKPRDESDPTVQGNLPALRDLAALGMATRVDRPGAMKYDYQTALDVPKADGKKPPYPKHPKFTVTSNRYYLADADFLVGLEGPKELLHALDRALADPVWPLYLGRKAFVPSLPVRVPGGLKAHGHLIEMLKQEPWWKRTSWDQPDNPLRIVTETGPGAQGDVRNDVPLDFVSRDRSFAARHVRDEFWTVPEELIRESPLCTSPN